ncbi:MAG: T9SS type A sorting domain-containing protein [Bacteroidales bacterium]|nr:T9SS type A sorting domain-containing protein [Bacteroidales bacterium]
MVKKYSAGKQEFIINGENLEPGIYFYTVRSGESSVSKKMIVE